MPRNKIFLRGMRKFDIFAQPLQLLVDKKEYHQTLFGSLLTLGLILLFANLLYTKLMVLFDRSNPTSLSSEVYHAQPDLYTLLPQNFTMTFAFQNSTFNTYINDSIYVVRAYIVKKQENTNNGIKEVVYEKEELPLVKCGLDKIRQPELIDYFSHFDLPTNYCIDWEAIKNISIQGTFDSPNYQYIIIQFNTCTEQTKKNQDCLDQDEIQKQLAQNYFSFQMSSYTTNQKNPHSPYEPKGQDIFTTISSQIYKEISIYLEPLTTITDYGLIQTSLEYEKTLRYGRHTEMLDLSASDLIMNVVLRLDTTEYVDYRTYPKIQEILAELGGLWQVLFSLFYIFSKPINKISQYLQLINQLGEFTENPIEENQDQLCSKVERDVSPLQKQALQSQKTLKNDEIIEPQEICVGKKRKTKKTILTLYTDYLKRKIITKNKKFQFGYLDAFKELQCIATQDDDKLRKFRNAQESIMNQINIVEILKKIKDIDKLKHILLTENQRIIFDNIKAIPKRKDTSGENQPLKVQTSPQDAVLQIIQDQNNEINCKLIHSLDITIYNLFQKQVKEQNKEEQQFQ